MRKGHKILQKKLKELESKLKEALALPPETPFHQHISQDIQQRFLFVGNLLSAESASTPKKPYHLQNIARRLLELESAFHEWDTYQTSVPDHVENDSSCSCTESCFPDDGEAADCNPQDLSLAELEKVAEASTELMSLEGFEEQGMVPLPLSLPVPVPVDNLEIEKTRLIKAERENGNAKERVWIEAERSILKKEKRKRIWFEVYLGAFTTGMMVGMVLMAFFTVILSIGFHHSNDHSFCLRPT